MHRSQGELPPTNPYASPQPDGGDAPSIVQRVGPDNRIVELQCDSESFDRMRQVVTHAVSREAGVDVPDSAEVIAIIIRPVTGLGRSWREWFVDRGMLLLCAVGAFVVFCGLFALFLAAAF